MIHPFVSFIFPSFNHGRFLDECLTSIYNQTLKTDFEVIVVNDGSTDETDEIVRGWLGPRLVYVCHPFNQGAAASVSHALTLTRGIYVAQLDADDRYRL